MGSRPALVPPVEWMRLPHARTLDTEMPMPPALFEIFAQRLFVSKIPSMESSMMGKRKQDAR